MNTRIKLTIYFDFIWPWCYVGQVSVERVEEEYRDTIVEWKPFLLRPDMPAEGMDLPEDFKADMADARKRIARVAAAGGLPLIFSDHVPNSRRALEATEYAKRQGRGEEFYRAVFAQLYGEGQDISRWEVLRSAAAAAGLDPDDMHRQTESGRFTPEVEEQAEAAREVGIHAVPTFVINDKHRIVGAQPFKVFKRAIEQILAEAE